MSNSNDRKSKLSRRAVESDLFYKLREDKNPLPVMVNINKHKKQ